MTAGADPVQALVQRAQALERERAQLELALEVAHAGTWELELPDRLTCSASLERILGMPLGAFGGTPEDFLALVHPDERDDARRTVRRALEAQRDIELEHRIVRPDGEVRWMHARGQLVRDDAGRVTGLRGAIIDVTERRLTERALAVRARQQATVADLGRRALAAESPPTLFQEATRAIAETLDIEYAKVLQRLPGGRELLLRAGVGWREGLVGEATVSAGLESQAGFTLAADGPVIVDDLRAETRFTGPPLLLDHGVVSGMSTIIRGPDKPWGVLGAHTTRHRPFTEDDVNFLQAVANVLAGAVAGHQADETQRLLADAGDVLNRSLDYVQTLRDLAHLLVGRVADWCAVHLVDETGTVRELEVSHRDPRMIDLVRTIRQRYPQPVASGVGVLEVVRTGRPQVFPEITDEMLERAAQSAEHLELVRAVGMRSVVIVPMTARGRTLGAILLARSDVRERYGSADIALAMQVAERAAVAVDNASLYRQAQETAAAREAFLSTASHELRTPLTSIVGFGGRLQRRVDRGDGLGPEAAEEIAVLVQEAERMRRTLEMFLDLARIESGRIDLDIEPVNLCALLADEARLVRYRYPYMTVVEHCPEAETIVVTDAHRVRQVVSNLLENAAKYAGERPRVALTLAPSPDGGAAITVRDNGPGIPEQDQPHIFERFYQGDANPHRRLGMGLGLYISKEIAGRLGAQLTFTTAPGNGTEFTLRLPRAIGEGAFLSKH